MRDGAPTQWSHMLGVRPAFRGARVGARLKLAQRDHALAAGVDLVEWTFDPLQATNAHLNLHVLGAVGAGYGADLYGALPGPLHRGTPTDRLMVEWRIREPQARDAGVADAPAAVCTAVGREWVRCVGVDTALTSRRVLVPVPPRFVEMQQQATDLALEWRLAVREVMTRAFAAGYRAVDFQLNRERGGGAYVLAKI
jgi:predicted GNAT superfamily acetyltransferase